MAEERVHRPASVLAWTRTGATQYCGGDYRIALVEPLRWEILHRDRHLEFNSSLEDSFQRAERHHRDRLRRRDLIVWSLVGVFAMVVLSVAAEAGRGTLWWFLVLVAGVFVGTSALVRFVAALTRNPANPYRRRYPWERRRRRRRSGPAR